MAENRSEKDSNLKKNERKRSGVGIDYFKRLTAAGSDGLVEKGLQLGVGAIIARTALRHLPAPLNVVAPLIAEKVIMKHGVEGGRHVLLKGLRWIKKMTDEEPLQTGPTLQ